MIFWFILTVVVVAVIGFALAFFALKLWFMLTSLSVTFSRLAMSLLVATGTSIFAFKLELFESPFLNFVVRAAIVYGIIYLVSFLPRVGAAIGTFCTTIISMLASALTVGVGFSIYDAIAKSETKFTESFWFYVIMGVIVLVATGYNWLNDIASLKERPKGPKFLRSKWFVRFGRVVASLIYGFTLFIILAITLNTVLPTWPWLQAIIYVALTSLAYVADLYLFDRAA